MSIDRNDPPEPPPEPSEAPASSERGPVGAEVRRGLAERQTLDRKTIDDSFERKRRELGLPVAPASVAPASVADEPIPEELTDDTAPDRSKRGLWSLDERRKLLLAAALLVAVSMTLGLVAGTCFGGNPEPPLEALGLGSPSDENDAPSANASASDSADDTVDDGAGGEDGLDAEQQAFAERRERELAARQSEPEPGSAVPDFTDHALVQELAGSWRLDLGRGRRGYRVRFGSDPVRKVHRQRFDVTLFDVVGLDAVGRRLPPYFTVFDLPEGKLLAFLDASGTFRLVLEDVRRESDGRLSWRGPQWGVPNGDRRYAERLDGESAWRWGRDREPEGRGGRAEPEPLEEEPTWTDRPEDNPPTDPPTVGVRPRPGPVSEDVEARLYDALERHLDELAFGLMERDVGRVYALWGGRPDAETRAAVEGLLARYSAMRVWSRPLAVDVVSTEDGPQAHFEVVVTIQGAPRDARNQRDIELRNVRWRGRLGLRWFGGGGSDGSRGEAVQLDPLSD